MGCNTSKESVPQNESENKENEDGHAAKSETCQKNDSSENHVNDSTELKSPSARTITLRSPDDASPTSPKDSTSAKVEDNSPEPRPEEAGKREPPQDEEEAATKIQAVFRGHKTRQSMKQPVVAAAKNGAGSGGNAAAADEPTREQLEEEFRLDDAELCHAATKIQASFRGHMTRKQEATKKEESAPSQEINDKSEELDIDLTDPDLNKAAVRIQASFRGHMVRKEHEDEAPNTSK